MPIPFQAATWRKRADIPSPTMSGAISGVVQGVFGASFHKASGVVQTMGPIAHSFEKYFGAAQASLDGGVTWLPTYQGDGSRHSEYVLAVFSLDTPSGTYHYQIRADLEHSFFAADGSLIAGGIKMYATDFQDPDVVTGGLGSGFFPLQQLYTWPGVTANPA